MLDPYRMIVVNIIASFILGISILAFKIIFKKKKLNLLLILTLISLLPLISILRKGTYESGDLTLQATGITSMYNTFKDGSIIPRWAGDVFWGYGSPQHLMMYFIARYTTMLIHATGIPALVSVKLFLIISYVLSGFSMFVFIKYEMLSRCKSITEKNKNIAEKAGFISGLLYLFSPYHLIDLHYRIELGELAAFIFLPLTFLFAKKMIIEKSWTFVICESIFIALIGLSHQAIAIFFYPLLFMYMLFYILQKSKKINGLIKVFASFFISSLLTMFYWAPILFEASKYTQVKESFGIEFHSFTEYLYSPWRYGFLFQGPKGELSFLIGYTHIIVILTSLYLLCIRKTQQKERKILFTFLLFFGIIFFFMQKISYPVWLTIPLIRYSQNSYRLLLLIACITSALGGLISIHIKSKKIFILLCIGIIMSTAINWGNRRTIPEISDDSYFVQHTYNYFTEGGGVDFSIPIWTDPKKIDVWNQPKSHLQIISGNSQFFELTRKTTYHEYLINVHSHSVIRENTLYFPGWTLYVNNKIYPFSYTFKKYPGVIVYSLPKGLYKVDVVFQNTLIRNIGDSISSITAFFIVLTLIVLAVKKFISHSSKA